MAHQKRDVSAGMFHIWAHCVWAAQAHYRDDRDRLEFLRRLAVVTVQSELRLVGFCLMLTGTRASSTAGTDCEAMSKRAGTAHGGSTTPAS